MTTPERTPLLSVTGDTLPVALERAPAHVRESKVLIMECTFLDERKPTAAVTAGGHVHLRDLIERAELLRADDVVLSHFSQIYAAQELPELLGPLAAKIRGRLWMFPVEPGAPIVQVPR